MKSKLIVLFTAILLLNTGDLFSQSSGHLIRIEIKNLKSNEGEVALQLSSINGEINIGKLVGISQQQCVIEIDSLNSGFYTIRYFHDENSNNKLDTNWMGIPIEGYGFSNNATSHFGAPSIDEQKFYLEDNLEMVLTPKY